MTLAGHTRGRFHENISRVEQKEDLTKGIIQQVIDELPDEFDSHEFLRKLMTIAPRVYVNQLKVKLDTGAVDPIQTAHSEIAKRLDKVGLLRKLDTVRSMNIRGEVTENQLWQKL